MTPLSRFVIAAATVGLPLLAGAEGKCNDDPFWLKDNRALAVTWTIPMPAGATVVANDPATLMKSLDKLFPVEPAGFPPEYSSNVWPVRYPGLDEYPIPPPEKIPQHKTPTEKVERLDSKDRHDAWLKNFPLDRDEKAEPITKRYFANKHVLFGVVLEHPPAIDSGKGFKLCSCILQRAVVVWDNGKEELWVRSRFRSSRDRDTWVNFEPADPIKFEFSSQTIWFPLAYNEVLPEQPAFLVLDVVTRNPLTEVVKSIDDSRFAVEAPRPVNVPGKEGWSLTRIRRRWGQAGEGSKDLSISPK